MADFYTHASRLAADDEADLTAADLEDSLIDYLLDGGSGEVGDELGEQQQELMRQMFPNFDDIKAAALVKAAERRAAAATADAAAAPAPAAAAAPAGGLGGYGGATTTAAAAAAAAARAAAAHGTPAGGYGAASTAHAFASAIAGLVGTSGGGAAPRPGTGAHNPAGDYRLPAGATLATQAELAEAAYQRKYAHTPMNTAAVRELHAAYKDFRDHAWSVNQAYQRAAKAVAAKGYVLTPNALAAPPAPARAATQTGVPGRSAGAGTGGAYAVLDAARLQAAAHALLSPATARTPGQTTAAAAATAAGWTPAAAVLPRAEAVAGSSAARADGQQAPQASPDAPSTIAGGMLSRLGQIFGGAATPPPAQQAPSPSLPAQLRQ